VFRLSIVINTTSRNHLNIVVHLETFDKGNRNVPLRDITIGGKPFGNGFMRENTFHFIAEGKECVCLTPMFNS